PMARQRTNLPIKGNGSLWDTLKAQASDYLVAEQEAGPGQETDKFRHLALRLLDWIIQQVEDDDLISVCERIKTRLLDLDPKAAQDEAQLIIYGILGKFGHFDKEPDYPKAMAFFQDAIQRKKDHPDRRDQQGTHPPGWRTWENHSDVFEGFCWLAEMHSRVLHSIPPVTEEEFQQLAEWFQTYRNRLAPLPDDRLPYGD